MNTLHLSLVAISDIHFGHRKTTTAEIVKHMRLWLDEHSRVIKDADLFIIAGDIFDRGLSYPSGDILLINGVMERIMGLCMKYNIVLRILEGTFSHDRGQSIHFNNISKSYAELDYKYIDYLSIEHHDGLGIDILYVPDEWNTRAEATQAEIKELLIKKGLRAVSITVMHGQFAYQIPHVPDLDFHDKDFFEEITLFCIIVGHIHRHVPNGKIVPPGSFDGLAHGEEEEPKGGVAVKIDDGKISPVQLVNTHATRYVSIHLTGDSVSDEHLINTTLGQLPDHSFIRLVGKSGNIHLGTLTELSVRYPTVVFSTKIIGGPLKKVAGLELPIANYNRKPLTKDNLVSSYMEYVDGVPHLRTSSAELVAKLKEHI